MGIDPVYLIIRSCATGKPTKPWFRIADTILPGLPELFRYSHNTNKYDEITVRATPSGENWNVILEYGNGPNEKVEIYGWYKDKKEADSVIEKKSQEAVEEGKLNGLAVRPAWAHDKDTTEVYLCSWSVKENRTLENGETEQTKVFYWWQVVQVKLQLREKYNEIDPKKEKERAEYMAKAASVALNMARRSKGELTEQEEDDLERRERNLGVVNLTDEERQGMDPMGDEERQRLMKQIQESDGDKESSDNQSKKVSIRRWTGWTKEQMEDPEIMGVEE
ncbi:Nn.00g042090.m01.CDS01 [Neocucurbitaria sp. VM-36]